MKRNIGANPKILVSIFLFLSSLNLITAQKQDNFKCPDKFEGFYPHLYSCDRYWKCKDGVESLEKCGNGLAFDDTDPTFATENCDYMHNIECGSRKEFEPPISTPNCPRLGAFLQHFMYILTAIHILCIFQQILWELSWCFSRKQPDRISYIHK